MRWRFWRKPTSCCQMGGWSFEFIPNTWSFASCFIVKTFAEQEISWPQRNWNSRHHWRVEPTRCFSVSILHWDPPVLVSRFTAMPIRDQISLNMCIETHSQSYGGLEAPGWLHGRSLWPICFFEMEGHALGFVARLWMWRTCSGNLQWRRLGCRQKHTQIGFWQCNLLWWMPCLFVIEDSEDSVIVERRIWNICCRFSCHGCHSHQNYSLLVAPSPHSHVFVLGFICSAWSLVTSRCWKTQAFELQGTLAPELSCWKDVASQSSFWNNQSSRCFNKTTFNCQAGIIDVSLWALEQFTKPTGRIRRPGKNLQTFSTASCINFKSQFTTSSFDRRLEPANPSTSRVWRDGDRHARNPLRVHSSMDWTSWCLHALDVTVYTCQKGHAG